MQTVAEDIETLEQWVSLRELSCDLGQGYYFARPLGPDAVPAFFLAAAATARLNADVAGLAGAAIVRVAN
jgi:EAL domain-containing protein (putative c-di-GMP-specific phosphodiesterase class I)